MRYYGFSNMYLSSIQQGLQAAHVITEMFSKYATSDEEFDVGLNIMMEWADDHKTIILLNGGNSGDLEELVAFFDSKDNKFPHDCFFEDQVSLNEALTSVGIILPSRIYEEGQAILRAEKLKYPRNYEGLILLPGYTDFESELIARLSTYRLAS